MHPTIADTVRLMLDLHRQQQDWADFPYWTHPIRVYLRLGPDASLVAKHAALLHDTVEDTGITLKYLEMRGYGEQILETVDLLTHDPKRTRRGYEDRIVLSGNVNAILVKLADVCDNSAPGRIAAINPARVVSTDNHVERYKALQARLEGRLRELAGDAFWPYEGDPERGGSQVCEQLLRYWKPHLKRHHAESLVNFAAAVQLEHDLEEGLFK